jgi:hypothetical protein
VPFDVRPAYEFYATPIGPVEAVTKDTRRVLVVPAGGAAVSTAHDRKARHGHSPLKDIGSYRAAAVNGADRALRTHSRRRARWRNPRSMGWPPSS